VATFGVGMVKVIEMGMMVVIGAIVISFGVYVGNEIIIKQAQDIKEFCAAPNNCTEYNHRNNLEQYIKECC
jgi:hypothetical protein